MRTHGLQITVGHTRGNKKVVVGTGNKSVSENIYINIYDVGSQQIIYINVFGDLHVRACKPTEKKIYINFVCCKNSGFNDPFVWVHSRIGVLGPSNLS